MKLFSFRIPVYAFETEQPPSRVMTAVPVRLDEEERSRVWDIGPEILAYKKSHGWPVQ